MIQKVMTAFIVSDPDAHVRSPPFLTIPCQSGGDVLPSDRFSIPLLALSSRLASMIPNFSVDQRRFGNLPECNGIFAALDEKIEKIINQGCGEASQSAILAPFSL
jgi:hypothetical protein